MLIKALENLGAAAIQYPNLTGVWVENAEIFVEKELEQAPDNSPHKIAAIGVKVDARGISRHGFALNVEPEMSYWEGIIGCGLDYPVTKLVELLPNSPTIEQVGRAVVAAFGEEFNYSMEYKPQREIWG